MNKSYGGLYTVVLAAWFDVSGLPAGAYVVQVQSEQGILVGKVVRE